MMDATGNESKPKRNCASANRQARRRGLLKGKEKEGFFVNRQTRSSESLLCLWREFTSLDPESKADYVIVLAEGEMRGIVAMTGLNTCLALVLGGSVEELQRSTQDAYAISVRQVC